MIGKRGCVPRTDAVVLEIGYADLGLSAVRPVSASQNTMELGFQPISAQDKKN